jgi:hypothetical protein
MAETTQLSKDLVAIAGAPKSQRRFRDYAIDRFDPDLIVRKLVANNKKYERLFPVLFRGLCAWVLDNNDGRFVHDSMVRYIGDLLAKAEMKRKEEFESKGMNPAICLLGPPLGLKFRPLLEWAYIPFGGISSILEACSSCELDQVRKSRVDNAKSVIDLMSVFHLYATTGGNAIHPKSMTVEFASKLVESLQRRRDKAKLITESLGADRIRDRWNEGARSSALIYAASLLEYKGDPLFGILFTRSPKYFQTRVLRWLNLGKRITKSVRKNCKFQVGKTPQFVRFPAKMKSVGIPPSRLRLCEALWLVEQYQDVSKEWPEIAEIVRGHAQKPCSIAERASPDAICAACQKFLRRFDAELQPVMRRN